MLKPHFEMKHDIKRLETMINILVNNHEDTGVICFEDEFKFMSDRYYTLVELYRQDGKVNINVTCSLNGAKIPLNTHFEITNKGILKQHLTLPVGLGNDENIVLSSELSIKTGNHVFVKVLRNRLINCTDYNDHLRIHNTIYNKRTDSINGINAGKADDGRATVFISRNGGIYLTYDDIKTKVGSLPIDNRLTEELLKSYV